MPICVIFVVAEMMTNAIFNTTVKDDISIALGERMIIAIFGSPEKFRTTRIQVYVGWQAWGKRLD